jgi:aminoglycoside phosphotransferase (APT) family kinase protein
LRVNQVVTQLAHSATIEAVISLGTIKSATGHEAIGQFVEERILPGTDWNLVRVRRKSTRLEPPHAYWVTYRVRIGRGDLIFPEPDADPIFQPAGVAAADPGTGMATLGEPSAEAELELPEPTWSEQLELRLAARGVFDPEIWAGYRKRIVDIYGNRPCAPLTDLGYPVVFDETQMVVWFYPVDPNLPGLWRSAREQEVLQLFRNHSGEILGSHGRATIKGVTLELARYLPEISAIIRYDISGDPEEASKTIFGKIQPGGRGAESNRVMTQIWQAAKRSQGRLVVPRPLGYHPAFELYLQESMPGEAIGSDRTKPEFLASALHAADALATLHESGIATDRQLPFENEIARLDKTLDQFALVHPKAFFLLRELLSHTREKLKKTPGEEWLPTHGDYKYDQILHHEGAFSLIDFDYFALAENSFDLAKYCAYAVPSAPLGWEQSVAAESARGSFLQRYRERRPEATLQRLPIYEAVFLGQRAMTMMWIQARSWERATESLLVMAMERLKSRSV